MFRRSLLKGTASAVLIGPPLTSWTGADRQAISSAASRARFSVTPITHDVAALQRATADRFFKLGLNSRDADFRRRLAGSTDDALEMVARRVEWGAVMITGITGRSARGLRRIRRMTGCLALAGSIGVLAINPVLAQDAPAAGVDVQSPDAAKQGAKPKAAAAAKGAVTADVADVVVVARDRAEKAQDVPLPISTTRGATAQREHTERIEDVGQKVPNFAVLAENPRVSAVTIRGIGGNASNDGSESSVGVIVDGVFFTHVGFVWLDLVDLEDVEIVRGPQGTLLGKNTTVGAVIINTQPPIFTRQTSIEATIGNYGHAQTKINTTGPVNDQLAYRVTFYGDKNSGYFTNTFNGQPLLDSNRYGIRAQLLWTPAEQFSDRLILEHYAAAETNNYNPVLGDPATYTSGAARNGWSARLKALGYTPTYNIQGNGSLDSQGPVHQRTEGVSNIINWQVFNDHTLTAVSAWRQFHFVPTNDGDETPLPIFGAGYNVDVNQYSQEIRLASPSQQKLEYQLGFYGLREQVWSDYLTNFYSDASAFFLSPTLPSSVLNGTQYGASGKAATTSLAGFGQATYHLTDKLALTGGLRDTQEIKSGSDIYGLSGGATLPSALAPFRTSLVNSLGGTGSVSGSHATNAIGWLVNPSYAFNENVLGYFSVAQGEKSGAINTTAHAATATSLAIPLFIQPEHSTDFELGAKTNWFDNRLVLNVNLFWNDITNYQATAVTTTGTITTAYLSNVGQVRMRGVEVEGRASPLENWWITYSGAFNDARYVSYANAPPPQELAFSAANPTGVTSVNLSGYQVIGAARWNAQFGLAYEHPLGPALGFDQGVIAFAWANESWRSTVSLNNPLSAYGWQPAYALTNAGIGVKTSDDVFSAQLWVRNLFDYRYLIAVAPASASTPYAAYLGTPRIFGLTLRTVL